MLLSANALGANGLSPFFNASAPVTVKIPHLYRSRRVICPSERALRISRRFLRAFSASRTRAGDAFLERKIGMWASSVLIDANVLRQAKRRHRRRVASADGRSL